MKVDPVAGVGVGQTQNPAGESMSVYVHLHNVTGSTDDAAHRAGDLDTLGLQVRDFDLIPRPEIVVWRGRRILAGV